MTQVECGGWILEVDIERTHQAYEAIKLGDPETCGCLYCRNFTAARHLVYPPDALAIYEKLGIRADREAETYEAGSAGDSLRLYGGWHHFIGRIQRMATEIRIGKDFSMLFVTARSCAEPPFQKELHVVQVEFCTRVPWVLNKARPED